MKLVVWVGRQWRKQLKVKCPLYGEDENHTTPALRLEQVFFRKSMLKSHCVSELEAQGRVL